METMKALTLVAPREFRFEERPVPALKDENSVLVQVKAVGICGSDMHLYHGEHPFAQYPIVPGHEISGVVVQCGNNVQMLKPGDHVVHEIIRWCGECYACRKGQHNVCENLYVTGAHGDGGFCEYMMTDAKQWHSYDSSIDFRQAAVMEPFTIGAQVVSRGNVGPLDTVLVYGAGPIGLIVTNMAKSRGARVICSEPVSGRREMAYDFGAQYVIDPIHEDVREKVMAYTEGKGPNVFIDAAGVPNSLYEASQMLTPGGTIVGMCFSNSISQITMSAITGKELNIFGSRIEMNKFPEVISGFHEKLPLVDKLITHVYPFEKGSEAFEKVHMRDPNVGKIIVTF